MHTTSGTDVVDTAAGYLDAVVVFERAVEVLASVDPVMLSSGQVLDGSRPPTRVRGGRTSPRRSATR